MEEPITAPAEALSRLEQMLTGLAGQLSAQVEALAREDTARRAALEDREDDLRRREMLSLARELLQEKELPAELADCLCCPDEAALRAAADALEEAFRAAVQRGVEERLLTDAPKTGAVKPLSDMTDEEYYAAVCRA